MFNADKIKVTCEQLGKRINTCIDDEFELQFSSADYINDKTVPDSGWMSIENGSYLKTAPDRHIWFKTHIKTPCKQDGKRLFLLFSTGDGWVPGNPQGLVYINGKIIQGIDENHRDVLVPWDSELKIEVCLYTGIPLEGTNKLYFKVELMTADISVEKLWYDLKVPYESSLLLSDTEQYYTIIQNLLCACNIIRFQTAKQGSAEFYDSVREADKYLTDEFYNKECDSGKTPVVYCMGHTHIDVAWLWTYAQTREKVKRSFSGMSRLLEEYPEFCFTASQPQLYKYLKESDVEVYNKVKEFIAQGRWEPEGAMWLEADCNIPAGESLIRQIMFGKRFMKEEFGVDSKILWLPDVFGYSAALPQILKKCGVEYFMTSKISWNETNLMPHTRFYWQGIDGTEIFTILLPMAYCGMLTSDEIMGCYKDNQDKDFGTSTFTTVGYGDGGGGTTREMLETQRRLNKGIPGMPRTVFSSAKKCFDNIKKDYVDNAQKLRYAPKWSGELYLELHRGTYTSVGENKKNNRRSEFGMLKAESLSTLDFLYGGCYEHERINRNWEGILLNQFHDVIPGSSFDQVYTDSRKMYADILSDIETIVDDKMNVLSNQLSSDSGVLVYNPLGIYADGTVRNQDGCVVIKNIPPFTLTVVKPQVHGNVIAKCDEIENQFFVVKLDKNGEITSIFDKVNKREALKDKGNVLTAYEDIPRCWDNWDISDFYVQKPTPINKVDSIEVVQDGDRAGIKIMRSYYNSNIAQTIWLYDGIDRIDFETVLDWHENHQIVKAYFPVNVNTNRATYEIQYGNTERPTHSNTSWDAAKFEVCGHKWADLSDNGYGVSLLNNCKYGYSCNGSTLGLTLVKCGEWPQHSDQGIHKMTYSIYPHSGGYSQSDTVKRAYELNQPLVYKNTDALSGTKKQLSLLSCDSRNIIIETVKLAEDSNDIIVRLYDSHNCKTNAQLKTDFNFKSVWICDMLENKIKKLDGQNNTVKVSVDGFEIVTLLFEI